MTLLKATKDPPLTYLTGTDILRRGDAIYYLGELPIVVKAGNGLDGKRVNELPGYYKNCFLVVRIYATTS